MCNSKNSAAEVKKKTKGKELDIVIQISKFLVRAVMSIILLVLNYHQDLDEVLSLELFQHFILEAYKGSFKDLKVNSSVCLSVCTCSCVSVCLSVSLSSVCVRVCVTLVMYITID